MSGHSTEEVMELSLDVDSDDRVLPSDPDDYDYDYQEVLRIPARVQCYKQLITLCCNFVIRYFALLLLGAAYINYLSSYLVQPIRLVSY